MSLLELISHAFLVAGLAFFFAGTVALLRFPDVYTRLHALAKADNLGLGFVLLGLMLRAEDAFTALRLLLIWLLALAASAAASFLIAHRARRRNMPWFEGKEERK